MSRRALKYFKNHVAELVKSFVDPKGLTASATRYVNDGNTGRYPASPAAIPTT